MNSQLTAISEGLSLRFPVQTGRVGGGGGGGELKVCTPYSNLMKE